ncbi:tRNA dihydrouridine synthase DusB [Lachnoanaerobaculum sp. Marseille-Q4761]|jgi:putative TIM-barrel protein, nifR3 family|uniref:tRNA dihydrouridine synthase DusB n=1 Tax=Lachnoanaerobaculum sp. Marseille-Q4761 TaxID=2819511 RepID=UPI001AA0CF23|nr:tRNA dihydrouridine synthase DusB [Lachnoanaerobaculum sp. Marseille-Q4761]MBO1870225.1 tRNA dihydrouridine synthase DusB [Lachnoanaerobaculum sp. Marseille-Q4761]
MKLKGFKIGNINIEGGLCLGPMAGVSDLPFRRLCKEMGASLLVTEMVSAKAIYFKNKNTEPLMKIDKDEHPVALQLFGSDPDIIALIAAQIENRDFDIFDFNMGCPVPKIVNNGEGSALMKNPKLVEEILSKLVKSVKKPVTLKIRKGFNEDNINAVEIAKIAEASGVSAIAVHARTREQYYSGKADWSIIKAVKSAVNIPVIGNGDVTDGKSAEEMYEYTGCDGIMIARAARGNPWIFREIRDYFCSKTVEKPAKDEVIDMILKHCRLQMEYDDEIMAVRKMRKHVAWYTHGMKGSSTLRDRVNHIESYNELEHLLRTV